MNWSQRNCSIFFAHNKVQMADIVTSFSSLIFTVTIGNDAGIGTQHTNNHFKCVSLGNKK